MGNVAVGRTRKQQVAEVGRRPPETPTALKLVWLGRLLQRRFDADLHELGLTMRHFGALGHLRGNPELSYSDLARRAHVTSQSMNATVRHLEELGAVRRSTAGPGHPARLEVTESGVRLLDVAQAAAERLDSQLAADLGEDGHQALDDSLNRLVSRSMPAAVENASPEDGWA